MLSKKTGMYRFLCAGCVLISMVPCNRNDLGASIQRQKQLALRLPQHRPACASGRDYLQLRGSKLRGLRETRTAKRRLVCIESGTRRSPEGNVTGSMATTPARLFVDKPLACIRSVRTEECLAIVAWLCMF